METETILTPKHEELIKRLQTLFPEANIQIEENLHLKNIWGVTIGYGPGVTYKRITRSYADGPDWDFSEEIREILLNAGFTKGGYYSTGHDEYHYEDYEVYTYLEKQSIEYIR